MPSKHIAKGRGEMFKLILSQCGQNTVAEGKKLVM